MVTIRKPYSNFEKVGIDFKGLKGESRTKQEFLDECDINSVIAKYKLTGALPMTNDVMAFYDDVSEVADYQTCLGIVQKAEADFLSLPSAVRARFNNNPADLLAFVSDSSNREEAVKLGLISSPSIAISTPHKEVALPSKDPVLSAGDQTH